MAVFGARSEFIQWAVGLNKSSVIMGFRTVLAGSALGGYFSEVCLVYLCAHICGIFYDIC